MKVEKPDLEAIEKLLDRASPGEWYVTHIFDGEEVISAVQGEVPSHQIGVMFCPDNAALITKAPQIIRQLIAHIKHRDYVDDECSRRF